MMYQIAGVRKNDAGQHQECYLANFDRWTFDEKEARLFDTCIRANQHAAHLRWNEHGRTSVRVEPAHPIADEDTRHDDMSDAMLYAQQHYKPKAGPQADLFNRRYSFKHEAYFAQRFADLKRKGHFRE